MKKFIALSLIIVKANFAYMQNLSIPDSISEFVITETYKNIAAFNIKFSVHSFNGTDKSNYLNTNKNFFFDAFIADYGFRLKMDIKKLPEIYPLDKYELYQIFIDGFNYINKNADIEVKKGVVGEASYGNYYLLAVNNENKKIKFISGQFFRNQISHDFSLDSNNPSSFIEYLKFKTFYLQTKDLVFIKSKGNALYYKSYSNELKEEITIRLSLKDIENPTISAGAKNRFCKSILQKN